MSEVKPRNPKDLAGSGKAGTSVLPVAVQYEVALALVEGALKYGANNWTDCGARASIYVDAAKRHLDQFWSGEDVDPDSGLSHITKAISSLMVLRDAMIRNNWTDDRPPEYPEDLPWKDWHEHVGKLQEKYGHVNPKHFFKDTSVDDEINTEGEVRLTDQPSRKALLRVLESLKEENIGRYGNWLMRRGDGLSGTLSHDGDERFPCVIDGTYYSVKGKCLACCADHKYDLVDFLGWEE